MNSYEFAYFGRDLQALEQTLEITALLQGARLRISGPDDTVHEAMRMVRVWLRRTS